MIFAFSSLPDLGRSRGESTAPRVKAHEVIASDSCVPRRSLFTGALGYEVTRSANSAVGATAIMAVLPAHLMRSVAGGYDNESVAVTAIVATFYCWVRSLRTSRSWPFAILCALAYIYMVAAWGGYIFVLNMIGGQIPSEPPFA